MTSSWLLKFIPKSRMTADQRIKYESRRRGFKLSKDLTKDTVERSSKEQTPSTQKSNFPYTEADLRSLEKGKSLEDLNDTASSKSIKQSTPQSSLNQSHHSRSKGNGTIKQNITYRRDSNGITHQVISVPSAQKVEKEGPFISTTSHRDSLSSVPVNKHLTFSQVVGSSPSNKHLVKDENYTDKKFGNKVETFKTKAEAQKYLQDKHKLDLKQASDYPDLYFVDYLEPNKSVRRCYEIHPNGTIYRSDLVWRN